MSEPWYKEGLQFKCTQCGNCCTGPPGYVLVNEEEIAAIAEFVSQKPHEVSALYTRRYRGKGRSLREKANGDCVFYEKQRGCTIYPVRPRQCRTWPFWDSNVATPEDWQRTCQVCPGSGQGELISEEEITRRLKVIPM